VIVIRLVIDFGEFIKAVLKRGVGGWEKRYGSCWVLWPLCVFGYIFVVVEGACVRDFRGLGLYTVGTVG
jgi:hypothetical protein